MVLTVAVTNKQPLSIGEGKCGHVISNYFPFSVIILISITKI